MITTARYVPTTRELRAVSEMPAMKLALPSAARYQVYMGGDGRETAVRSNIICPRTPVSRDCYPRIAKLVETRLQWLSDIRPLGTETAQVAISGEVPGIYYYTVNQPRDRWSFVFQELQSGKMTIFGTSCMEFDIEHPRFMADRTERFRFADQKPGQNLKLEHLGLSLPGEQHPIMNFIGQIEIDGRPYDLSISNYFGFLHRTIQLLDRLVAKHMDIPIPALQESADWSSVGSKRPVKTVPIRHNGIDPGRTHYEMLFSKEPVHKAK